MSKIKIEKKDLKIEDKTYLDKLTKSNISSSLIDKIIQCPASWALSKGMLDPILIPDPESPALWGSLFHDIMEKFFSFPKGERDKELIPEIEKDLLNKNKLYIECNVASNEKAMNFVKECLDNYFESSHDPNDINIATIDVNGKEKKGLELFISGQITGTTARFVGFIDRLQADPKNSKRLVLEDYKTGKYRPSGLQWGQDFSYTRQLILYSDILRQQNYSVYHARLIYPKGPDNKLKIERVDIENVEYRKKALDDFMKAQEILDRTTAENSFEFIPSPLCSWCDFVNACPVAKKGTKEKAVLSRKKKPTAQAMKDADLL